MHTKSLILALKLCLGLIFFSQIANAALPYPLPATQDTAQFGRYLQRTMKLLATSTPAKRNTVKILVYGQSIAKQEWSDTVRKYLKFRFPHANIIMINRSIGGCWAGCLQNPVVYDVNTFYPDLILFDVYGWSETGAQGTEYENIIASMRQFTSAEIAMQGHQIGAGKDNAATDNTDFNRLATKYGVEFIDIRTPWKQYLTDNGKTATQLTADGTHLNDHGNFLMARLYLPYLQYKPQFNSDPFALMRSYKIGEDIFWENGKLTLPFNGNKIDLVTDAGELNSDSAAVFIDGFRPSTISGTTMFIRPNEPYDTVFKHFSQYDWPWQKGSIMKFDSPKTPLVAETWTLEMLTYNASSNFTYKVTGSKTGFDGNGSANISSGGGTSGSKFLSTSKRVGFDPANFWFSHGPYPALPLGTGFKVVWEARPFYKDVYKPTLVNTNTLVDSVITLAQGLMNGPHTLVLSATGVTEVPLKEIRVYRPFFKRIEASSLPKLAVQTLAGFCTLTDIDISDKFIDVNNASGTTTYWTDSLALIPIANEKLAQIPGKYWIKKTSNINPLYFDIKPIVLTSIDCTPQLVVTNPSTVCSPFSVDITTSFIDLMSISGTVQYFQNEGGNAVLYNPEAVTSSGIYFLFKANDSGFVSNPYSVTVRIRNCSSTTSGLIINVNASLEVYPNPTSAIIYLQSKTSGNITIVDVLGNLVFEELNADFKLGKEIDLSNFERGVYTLKFISQSNSIYKKLILE